MSCCCAKQQEKPIKSTQKLPRERQVEQDIRKEKEDAERRLNEERRRGDADRQKQKDTREQGIFVDRVEQLAMRFNEDVARERGKVQALQNKEEQFKKALEREVGSYSKAMKEFVQEVESVEELRQLEQIKATKMAVSFSSIEEYFGPPAYRSIIHENSEIVVQRLIEVYSFFAEGKIFERRLLLCVACYVRFLEEVLRAGYSETVGDRQLKDTREFMRDNANVLFLKLEDLVALAKEKFTKERSRIIEEAEVDTSLEEMKLRNKIDELQRRIQELLEENTRQKTENELLTAASTSTISGLREQLGKKEVRGMEQVVEALGQLQKTLAGKEEVEEHFQQLERLLSGATVVYSSEQTAEVLKAKDLSIQTLQAQVVRLQKERSLLSEDTEPERRQLAQDLLTKEREIEHLTAELQERQRRISMLEANKVNIIRKPQSEADELVRENSRLAEELLGKQGIIATLEQKMDEMQYQARQNAEKLQQLPRDPKDAQSGQLSKQAKAIASLEEQLQESRSKQNERAARVTELERKNLVLNEEVSHLTAQIAALKHSLLENSKREEELCEEKRLQTQQSEEQRLKQQGEAGRIASQRDTLRLENQALKTKNITLASEFDQLTYKHTQQVAKMQADLQHLQEQLTDEQFKYSELELRANKAEGDVLELKNEAAKADRARRELEADVDRLKSDLERARAQVQKVRRELQVEKELHQQTLSSLQEMSTRIHSEGEATNRRMRTASFVEHRTLFIGDILQRRKGEKKYLMDAIEGLMMRQIEKTKLLYEFRRDQKINFHNFIDGHSNLVLVLQTEKALLACYYSGPLQETAPMTEEALLISLDSRKTYFLNTEKHNPGKDPNDKRLIRGMVFDKYFLIFGNAQVRLRTSEARVFSNFGIMSSYFDARREKVAALLHDGTNNEVDIVNYEIHEVFFSEEFVLETTN